MDGRFFSIGRVRKLDVNFGLIAARLQRIFVYGASNICALDCFFWVFFWGSGCALLSCGELGEAVLCVIFGNAYFGINESLMLGLLFEVGLAIFSFKTARLYGHFNYSCDKAMKLTVL